MRSAITRRRREVHGVDLSEDMLRRAQEKVDKRGFDHVKRLQVMDVTSSNFPDETFDAVTAQFLITLVPEPEKALTEFARVLRPGGEIVLVNHFGQPSGRSPSSRSWPPRSPRRSAGAPTSRHRADRILGADRSDGGRGIEVALPRRLLQADAASKAVLTPRPGGSLP